MSTKAINAAALAPHAAANRMSSGDFNATVTAVTSAFGDPTRRAIYLMASETEAGITATAAAARFGLHPNVARHHLEKLAAGGYLDVEIGRPSGAGRPSKRYRSNARPVEIASPVRRDDLLVALLARSLQLIPREIAETMAEEVGETYGTALARAIEPADHQRSLTAALRAVAEALTAHGFATHPQDDRPSELRIVSDLCPFGDVAIEHPVMCAIDRGMVRGMLNHLYGEVDPTTSASRPSGATACEVSV